MKRTVSLKDIAKEVGVSAALVSYVLNGKEKEARVGAEIAAKIKKTAKKMNYQPNLIARSLKFGKTKTIGLIVADISNPFFSNLARVIENEANLYGYTVIFGSSDEDLNKTGDLINALLNRQVDGIIITPVENSEKQILELKEKQVPFVLLDRYFPKIKANAVFINNYEIAYNAVRHLIDNGFKQIGMIAYDSTLEHMKERIRGYEAALKDNNIKKQKDWLIKIKYADANSNLEQKLSDLQKKKIKVDSLLFATVSLALKSLHIINEKQIEVPGELGLISFDESEAFDFFYSPLTYIKQDIRRIGEEAVRLLMKTLSGSDNSNTEIKIDASLVVRASSKKN